jgi:hypothetical protein
VTFEEIVKGLPSAWVRLADGSYTRKHGGILANGDLITFDEIKYPIDGRPGVRSRTITVTPRRPSGEG